MVVWTLSARSVLAARKISQAQWFHFLPYSLEPVTDVKGMKVPVIVCLPVRERNKRSLPVLGGLQF